MFNRKGDFMFLSICTPTYNRRYTLERVYKSLLNQNVKSFEWIIVDDGSTDKTKVLVNKFIREDKINIRYIFQNNQGKHIALNKGMEIAEGELFTCLDSDDWLYPNSINIIKKEREKVRNDKNIVGIISLDSYENEKIIGDKFPRHLKKANWINLIYKYKVLGDKDYYFRTKEIKKIQFPSYSNNKHMPPGYQYWILSKSFDFYLLNRPTKYVEYLEDGISRNKYNKYIVAPDNFARFRYEIMDLIPNKRAKIINAIHFNSSIALGTIKLKPKKIKNKILVTLTKPLGYLLSVYIKLNVNKDNNISHKI